MPALALCFVPTEELAANSPVEIERLLSEVTDFGQLVEFSAPLDTSGACTSSLIQLFEQVQKEGDTIGWIRASTGPLFPPNLLERNIDFESLIVVQTPPKMDSADIGRAAEFLLHSGAFGLVVVDLRLAELSDYVEWQNRVLILARKFECRVVLLTDKVEQTESVSPLVSVRIEPNRDRWSSNRFAVENRVVKSKVGLDYPSLGHFSGPLGMV